MKNESIRLCFVSFFFFLQINLFTVFQTLSLLFCFVLFETDAPLGIKHTF